MVDNFMKKIHAKLPAQELSPEFQQTVTNKNQSQRSTLDKITSKNQPNQVQNFTQAVKRYSIIYTSSPT